MSFIKRFTEVGLADIATVGGKNASLGEMITHLAGRGINVPSGFAITADGYRAHLTNNGLTQKINSLLERLNPQNLAQLELVSTQIRTLIVSAPLPAELATAIQRGYQEMEQEYGASCDVAVRSSATAEDLPEASFAGQQETLLGVRGIDALLKAVPQIFASLFTARAISYREALGFAHTDIALSIGVQKMVRSDLACSGVMFTLDTESGHRDAILITASYGLGESIVQGSVNPDEHYVHKTTLRHGFRPLLKKRLGSKTTKMVYASQGTTTVEVPQAQQLNFALTDEEVLALARCAITIEDYYSAHHGRLTPMDIEWAKDGIDGQLYILQARPETVHSQRSHYNFTEQFTLTPDNTNLTVLATGKSIGRKIATGTAIVIQSPAQLKLVRPGNIIVTDITDPDWEPVMKIAGGIVTNRGGRTCHAAIISRELGIAAIVGTQTGTDTIIDGQPITLDCSKGETGVIYAGALPFSVDKIMQQTPGRVPIDIMLNLGNPDEAFNMAQLPNNGVGLARLEFIINNAIKVHPCALINPENVTDMATQKTIDELTADYADKSQYFIDRLAQEAGTIAAAFYPKPVIIRMSDFKSNEYRELIGGSYFEPLEENPMLGFRGASRYYHPNFAHAFSLECKAMKKVRDEMGLTNAKLMLPFVRTLDEARNVIALMAQQGLRRGENELELYMMCEIPSNVILIEQFAQLFDGFSIGSNDLTQMTLGVDRDSALVAHIFDERNEAVKIMLSIAIAGARKQGKKIGICGQAPSDYPELADFLMGEGINSISLTPDTITAMFARLGEKNVNAAMSQNP